MLPPISSIPLPRAPYDIQEEVELYARQQGRSAKIHFVPVGGWMVRFGLRSNDPRMLAYQQGMAPEPPTEDVYFQVPDPKKPGHFIPLNIEEMGPSGVRQFLERGNTWSGRGEFRSLEEQLRKSRENNRYARQEMKRNIREEAKARARDKRRQYLKIPFLRVGIDLRSDRGAS